MIRIYADFNDKTEDGGYWILEANGVALEDMAERVGLSSGDHILLYQDDDDFEVEATLLFKFVAPMGHEGWVAYPDWNTLTRKSVRPEVDEEWGTGAERA